MRDVVQKQFLLLVGRMNNAVPNISDLAKKYHTARPGLGDAHGQQMQEVALPGVLEVLRKTTILRQMFAEGTKKVDSDDQALLASMDDLIAELKRLINAEDGQGPDHDDLAVPSADPIQAGEISWTR